MSNSTVSDPLHQDPNEAKGARWAGEPFRIFFPLGIASATFGLLLWPLYYCGWWPIYPALQHPRVMIFGFGLAFLFGFMGTAWPRFLGARALRAGEVGVLVGLWLAGQICYAKAAIGLGDCFLGSAALWLLLVLLMRLGKRERRISPPGVSVALISLALGAVVLFLSALGWTMSSPASDRIFRLLGYQGVLLLPILGIGAYLFPRMADLKVTSESEAGADFGGSKRTLLIWTVSGVVLLSFLVEALFSIRVGNGLRGVAVLGWAGSLFPREFWTYRGDARVWGLRLGTAAILSAFLCRVIWPERSFAFEHLLFLGGFTQLILLAAERVCLSHGRWQVSGKTRRWAWISGLLLLTAATRMTADFVVSTRVSHQVYASFMLIGIFVIWGWKRRGKATLAGGK